MSGRVVPKPYVIHKHRKRFSLYDTFLAVKGDAGAVVASDHEYRPMSVAIKCESCSRVTRVELPTAYQFDSPH
jgi:hypothetical protein